MIKKNNRENENLVTFHKTFEKTMIKPHIGYICLNKLEY